MMSAFSSKLTGSAVVHMCAYNLRRPDTKGWVKKPTMLKGTVGICKKMNGRCDKSHSHEHVMGQMGPNEEGVKGCVSRWAGGYTKEFCEAVVAAAEEVISEARCNKFGKNRKDAFPAEWLNEEEVERDDEGNIVERDDEGNIIEEILMDGPPPMMEGTPYMQG